MLMTSYNTRQTVVQCQPPSTAERRLASNKVSVFVLIGLTRCFGNICSVTLLRCAPSSTLGFWLLVHLFPSRSVCIVLLASFLWAYLTRGSHQSI